MAREPDTDAALEALFSEARHDAPDDGLMARVLADAATLQDQAAVVAAAPPRPGARRGWMAGLVDMLGGWTSVGGITAAGVMGLAVGFSSPDAVVGWFGTQALGLETLSYDITPDMGELWLEADDV